MSKKPKIYTYKSIKPLVLRIRDDLNGGGQNFVLIYAFNGTGKTRLSMEFKNVWSKKKNAKRDTLYFNAFTEDLFVWDNDLENDSERVLKLNSASRFFEGLKELEMESRIRPFLYRYADFDFKIDYDKWEIRFSREVQVQARGEPKIETIENIKISRGEENIFIWCFFLAIAELAILGDVEAYKWVKYLYIDDPISSLDDNNAITVACDLAQLLKQGKDRIKAVISSHHSLFFNIMCNELKLQKHHQYFLYLHKNNKIHTHTLQATDQTPSFHHVALLSEIKKAAQTGQLYTFHFNTMRSVLEKTAVFFGMSDFSACIEGVDDEVLYARALNLFSHGQYSIFEPREMADDNKELFKKILTAFLNRYSFNLPELITDNQQAN